MATLTELTEQDLLTNESFNRVKRFASDCIEHSMAPESRRFADILEKKISPSLQSANPEFFAQYQQIIIALKFTALVTLDQKTVYKLMRFHLLDAFRESIDINDRMTGRMYLLPDTAFEDEKLAIIQEIKENNQRLGSQQITLKDSREPSPPLVKYWLADYDRWFGPEKHSGLERQQYLTQNPNVQTLNQSEKNILAEILLFYDNLKPIPISTIDKYLGLTEGELNSGEETSSMPIETPGQKTLSEQLPPQNAIRPINPTQTEMNEPPAPRPAEATTEPSSRPRTAPPPSRLPRQDSYKEPIEEEDLSGPQKPPTRPAPRIQGNIVDLKNWQNKNQE